MNKPLILASASIRRKELLDRHNIACEVVSSNVEEVFNASVSMEQAIMQIATDKALSVQVHHPERVILAADTVVVCNHEILLKPIDKKDAYRMLSLLSNNTHQVITGVCILHAS